MTYCCRKKNVGKPCEGEPHARFDERRMKISSAYSTRPKDHLLEKNKKTRKDVVTYHYRNRSWILCHQNSPCVLPDRAHRV